MKNDRNYLRMMHDVELTRYAQDNVRTELEFVLLDRLRALIDAEDRLEAAQEEIKGLNARVDLLTCELLDMQDATVTLED